MVQSIEKGPGFGHVQKKKESLIISKLTISFFFSSLSQFVLFDEGFWSLFFGACVREREGLLQVYLPYLQGYYIIHGMIIVLTLALGIISFPFFSLFLCLVDTCFNLHVD